MLDAVAAGRGKARWPPSTGSALNEAADALTLAAFGRSREYIRPLGAATAYRRSGMAWRRRLHAAWLGGACRAGEQLRLGLHPRLPELGGLGLAVLGFRADDGASLDSFLHWFGTFPPSGRCM